MTAFYRQRIRSLLAATQHALRCAERMAGQTHRRGGLPAHNRRAQEQLELWPPGILTANSRP